MKKTTLAITISLLSGGALACPTPGTCNGPTGGTVDLNAAVSGGGAVWAVQNGVGSSSIEMNTTARRHS